jgi:hypothetical protein
LLARRRPSADGSTNVARAHYGLDQPANSSGGERRRAGVIDGTSWPLTAARRVMCARKVGQDNGLRGGDSWIERLLRPQNPKLLNRADPRGIRISKFPLPRRAG